MYSSDDKAQVRNNFVGPEIFFSGKTFFLLKPSETDESHSPNSSVGTEGDFLRLWQNTFLLYP